VALALLAQGYVRVFATPEGAFYYLQSRIFLN